MTQTHTFQHFREETYYPEFMNRKQYQAWQIAGSEDIRTVLNKKHGKSSNLIRNFSLMKQSSENTIRSSDAERGKLLKASITEKIFKEMKTC